MLNIFESEQHLIIMYASNSNTRELGPIISILILILLIGLLQLFDANKDNSITIFEKENILQMKNAEKYNRQNESLTFYKTNR